MSTVSSAVKTNTISSEPPSLDCLKSGHADLLTRLTKEGETAEVFQEVRNFIEKGRDTGKLLESNADRRASQAVLDYWATVLYGAGNEAPNPTLATFDPSQLPTLEGVPCPYQGLDPFRDGRFFYGREQLVKDMLAKLAAGHFVVVVGPSGSGKSSAALGGLLPKLKEGAALPGAQNWRYPSVIVPGSDPLGNLQRSLAQLGAAEGADSNSHQQPTMIVIDQFEETFTLCTSDEAGKFIDALLQRVDSGDFVVLTIRSDFWEELTRYSAPIYKRFKDAKIEIEPLNDEELRAAIEKPAAEVDLKIASEVVDDLVAQIRGVRAGLPLLQFTLRKLWKERDHNRVTWQRYHDVVGSPHAALNKTADDVYKRLTTQQQLDDVRAIFLKLVKPTTGSEFTSKRVTFAELVRGTDFTRIEDALAPFVDAELIRVSRVSQETYSNDIEKKFNDNDQIEIAHEALVRNWETLKEWLDEERVNLRNRAKLAEDAKRWERDKDSNDLLRGSKIDEAQKYTDLNDVEKAFVQASNDLRAREASEKEAQRKRKQKWLVAAMAVVLLFASAAFVLKQQAQGEAKQAKLHLSQYWAVDAESNVVAQPQGSLLLAAEAVALSTQLQGEPIPRTVQALQSILTQTGGEPLQTNDNRAVADATLLTLSPDQHWLAAGSRDGAVYLWDLTTAKSLTATMTLHPHTAAVTTMAFSSDGHWLATGSKDHTVQLTDMNNLAAAAIPLTGHTDDVTTLAFMSTHGSEWLATGSADKTIRLFDLDDRDSTTVLTEFDTLPEEAGISKVIFSPDGHWLATVTVSDTLRLWNIATIATDKTIPAARILSSDKDGLIAFSPSGKWLVAASNTSPNVQLYAMESPDEPFLGGQLPGQGQGVYALAFDTTEQWLAVGSDDGSVGVWELGAVVSQLQLPLPEQPPVVIKQSSPEQPPVVKQSSPEQLPKLSEQPSAFYPVLTESARWVLPGHLGSVTALAFASGGDYLATGGFDHSFQLWRMADLVAESGSSLDPWLELYGSDGVIETILWSDQKGQVFTYSSDGSIRLWEPLASPPALKELTTEELIALACARAGRDFSEEEKQQYFGDNQYVSTCSQINVQPR